jgi:adhesin transport system membrane fusion protein
MGEPRSDRHRGAWPLFGGVALFFVVFVLWAGNAEIDQVTRGPADVVPTQELQELSHFSGGILQSLEIREGQSVQAGDVIAEIKNTHTRADYLEAQVKASALRPRLTRLQAEVARQLPAYGPGVERGQAVFVAAERQLAKLRDETLQANLDVHDLRAAEVRQEVEVQRTKLSYLEQQRRYAREEADILRPLVASGSAPRTALLRVKRVINQLNSEIDTAQNAIPKSTSKLTQIESEREQALNEFRSKTATELNKTRDALAKAEQQIRQGTERVERTQVRTPTDGIVQAIKIPTVGAVVEPGATIVEIVPITETLRVEARIQPQDVAFLHPGQRANVKVSAYDYATYGGLDGTVEAISADTLVDEKTDETYYRVIVRTDSNTIQHQGRTYPIQPGMTAQVDILTGKETVLDIALAPLRTLADRALRER